MSEKRFTLDDGLIWDNGEECEDVVDLLNELATKCSKLEKENERLKSKLSDTRHHLDNIFKYRRQMEGN